LTEFELNYKRTVKPENYESITVELKKVFDDKNMTPTQAQAWLEGWVHSQLNRQLRTLAINDGDEYYITVLKRKVDLNGGSR